MTTRLTSFATYKDLLGWIACKAEGHSDTHCYNEGDNGTGAWGDITAQEHTPMCALGEEVCIEQFGSWNAAHNKIIVVTCRGREVRCRVCDKGPDGVCDLNPAALIRLGLSPETELDEGGEISFSS